MRPFERRKRELVSWVQQSMLSLLRLVVVLTILGAGEAVSAETMTLHIPSTIVTLRNGLTVVVSAKNKLPMASISVRFKVGSVDDPEDKAGLAAMTARLLDKGTTQRTATAIADELDFLGARLEASAGETGSTVSFSLLAKDVERGLGLLADLLQHSRFEAAELERERAQMLSEMHQRQVDPGQVVWEIFRETLYAGHPLHRPIIGYAHTVSQITREEIVAFHQRFYVPNNAIVVMVGAFPEMHMLEVIERYLGAWPARPLEPRALPQPASTTGKQVRIVDMEVNQSYVQLGHLSVRRAEPEFAAIRAMNYILGGGEFVSRLTGSIREQQGLAYAVDSEFVGGSQFPGFFFVELQTSIPTTSQALKSLLAVVKSMQQTSVTPEELSDMKLYYQGSLPGRAETYEQVTELLIDREFFGLPDGYWEAEIRRIQQLSAEDIQQLAQRYLDTDNFVLALVSNRAQLDLAGAPIPADAIRDVPAP
ncbi:MAG: M16 family metallopeptidase [Candidatus Entotheonellia bacterium]